MTASIVWDVEYTWSDQEWMENRYTHNGLDAPITIYEVHLGSWKRVPEEGNRSLSYRELAEQLPQYVQQMWFTHVEFLPGHGASLLWSTGSPNYRVIRTHKPLRDSSGFYVLD